MGKTEKKDLGIIMTVENCNAHYIGWMENNERIPLGIKTDHLKERIDWCVTSKPRFRDWIATVGGGLIVCDKEENRECDAGSFTVEDTGNTCYSLLVIGQADELIWDAGTTLQSVGVKQPVGKECELWSVNLCVHVLVCSLKHQQSKQQCCCFQSNAAD